MQLRFRSILEPPAPANSRDGLPDHTWDFFQDGRLCFLYASREEGLGQKEGCPPNAFLINAVLCATQRLNAGVPLSNVSEMHRLFEDDERVLDAAAKSAQHGPQWDFSVIQGLLTTSKNSSGPAQPWTTVHDHVDIVEAHPYLGDGAISTLMAMVGNQFPNTIRHCLCQVKYKLMEHHVPYVLKRLEHKTKEDWAHGQMELYSYSRQSGQCVLVPKCPKAVVSTPDPEDLKALPGCFEAYLGISKLNLEVCRISGSRVPIAPEQLQQFQSAPNNIQMELKALEDHHKTEVEGLLTRMESTGTQDDDDPRLHTEPPEEDPEGDDGAPRTPQSFSSKEFTSEEDLRKEVEVTAEARAQGLHSLRMLRDAKNNIYLVATADDMTLPKWTLLGSYGAGKSREVSPQEDNSGPGITFGLPLGDCTPVMVSATGLKEDAQEEELDFTAPTTLYKATKTLMKASQGAPITLSGMGLLTPTSPAIGKHGYTVEHPSGDKQHVPMCYIPKGTPDTKKATAGIFFGHLAKCGLKGVITNVWKCSFKPVHNKIHPMKPYVMTSRELKLEKNRPKLVGGGA